MKPKPSTRAERRGRGAVAGDSNEMQAPMTNPFGYEYGSFNSPWRLPVCLQIFFRPATLPFSVPHSVVLVVSCTCVPCVDARLLYILFAFGGLPWTMQCQYTFGRMEICSHTRFACYGFGDQDMYSNLQPTQAPVESAVQQFDLSLWREYYRRRDVFKRKTIIEAVIDLNFIFDLLQVTMS